MGILVSMGIAAIIEALQDSKNHRQIAAKVAKLFVAIERAAESSVALTSAIERARQK